VLENCADIASKTNPSWIKTDLKVLDFAKPIWTRSTAILKQNMASGRILSADDENFMHFFVLQQLNSIMTAANIPEADQYFEELLQLMTQYRDMGGRLQ
jgi:hypothetical protein